MCGGGGGGSGETKYNWNDTLAPQWKQLLGDATARAYNNPYQQYDAPRIAAMSPDQLNAMQAIRSMTAAGGTPAALAANNQAESTLKDNYLTGANSNPMAGMGNGYAGKSNPYASQANAYSGYGPKFEEQLQGELGDITNAYNQGTAADTARMFAQSGAWGGSAHQNAVANNQVGLARQLGRTTSNAYQNQFNQSAGLAENQLGRMNADEEARIGRLYGSQENTLNRGNQDWENERQRQIQAMGAGQNANNLFFQGAQSLMGIGDAQRGIDQDQLNMAYQDWLNKNNQDFKNADWLSGLYSRAQGGMSANSTTQSAGYQASPFGQLLGGYLGYRALT